MSRSVLVFCIYFFSMYISVISQIKCSESTPPMFIPVLTMQMNQKNLTQSLSFTSFKYRLSSYLPNVHLMFSRLAAAYYLILSRRMGETETFSEKRDHFYSALNKHHADKCHKHVRNRFTNHLKKNLYHLKYAITFL